MAATGFNDLVPEESFGIGLKLRWSVRIKEGDVDVGDTPMASYVTRGESVENEVESECGLNNEVEVESEVQVESDGEGDNEVEVESEDEGHMDHLSGDEYVEEEEEEEMGFGLEDSDEECMAEVNCRGLSDDEWHSDVLVSPQNSGSENESEDRPQPGPFQTYEKQKSMTDYKWEVGTVFADKAHFIEAIRTYVVHTGRALKYWSRSRFSYEAVCDSLDNNICEAFNSVIVLARGKPIITMLEEIRLYLMKRWATNRTKVAAMEFTICLKINTRLIKESNLSRYWIPSWYGRKLFEVRHTAVITNKFTVNLETKECSCRKWMISGIPCCHAIAAMNYCNEDPKNLIPSCFTRTTYEATYAAMIYPVNGQMLWEKTSFVDVLPPIIRKMPGRPKKKRKLEAWELTKDATQMNIGGHRKKCTICRKLGHNRSKCPLRPPITEPTCPSDSQTQQPNPQSPQPSQPTQESTTHSTPPIMRKKLPFKRRIN
ncbi:uncharacterized protein LOC106773224 [Vigna radiata var. radiata]|uniref:Uncharacterized protein LOC106773224 n=1 Tax=Vigna radiata var. radiata TaxID=3916 RepID=A0A1S3VB32_VIGRR|nr:uncharacterized protein LOC106773224 [Vigna radiata var. radiata]